MSFDLPGYCGPKEIGVTDDQFAAVRGMMLSFQWFHSDISSQLLPDTQLQFIQIILCTSLFGQSLMQGTLQHTDRS